MKKVLLVGFLCTFMVTAMAWGGEKAPQSVVDLANTKLANIGGDPVIVKAVKEQNNKGLTLLKIKEMDEKWKADPGVADYMQVIMDSECGKYLRKLQDSADIYAEIFVMDNQGANVAMTNKTSDYWQGDEAKFKKSFNEGKGAVFVDEVEFDDSSQAYLVQVSVPVMENGTAIGAVTFGIDVDKVE